MKLVVRSNLDEEKKHNINNKYGAKTATTEAKISSAKYYICMGE